MSRCQIGPKINNDLLKPLPGYEPEQCTDKAKHSVVIRTDSANFKVRKLKVKLCNTHFYTFKTNHYELGRHSETMSLIEYKEMKARDKNNREEKNIVRIDFALRENRL